MHWIKLYSSQIVIRFYKSNHSIRKIIHEYETSEEGRIFQEIFLVGQDCKE